MRAEVSFNTHVCMGTTRGPNDQHAVCLDLNSQVFEVAAGTLQEEQLHVDEADIGLLMGAAGNAPIHCISELILPPSASAGPGPWPGMKPKVQSPWRGPGLGRSAASFTRLVSGGCLGPQGRGQTT